MTRSQVTAIKPTNHSMDNVTDKSRYVITRSKAQDLLCILCGKYPIESSRVTTSINYELEHSQHDTHISFYVDNNDVDGLTAIQYACTLLIFNYIGD